MERKINTHSLRGTWLKVCIFLFLSSFSPKLIAQITVNVQNKPIKEILKVIESKSEYRFFYNEGLKGLDKVTSLQVENTGIDETMKKLLQDSEILHKLEGNKLVALMAKENSGLPQKITGMVTDMNGEPIVGASIFIKGTKNGTITNVSGQFSVEVTEKSVIIVSFIGYKEQEITIGNKKSIVVKLSEDAEILGEVMVTALGIKREEKALGYAVQAVKGEGLQTVKGVGHGNFAHR